ncbi:MAG: MBL fold metallo-hydrolase [Lautropia sp.]
MTQKSFRRWQVGEVTVTRIVELETLGGTHFILPEASRARCLKIGWLAPHFMNHEGRLRMNVQALVVQTPTRRIVVDTCLGNDKRGREVPHWNGLQTGFLQDLADAGLPRESIDTVLCTHLHVDHVGWNTMFVDGKWVPTFPNARYLIAAPEYAHWRARHDAALAAGTPSPIFDDSVAPVFDAGLVDLVDVGYRICDEVRLLPTPGHTPGHVSVEIASGNERALISGDFVHHPCQLAMPQWTASVDDDPSLSTRTRRETLARLAGEGTLLIGTHFAGPTAGRVAADGDAWRLDVD